MHRQPDADACSVLLITNLFPNTEEPVRGIFILNLVRELRKKCLVSVVSPLPYFPAGRFFGRFARYRAFSRVPREFEIEGIRVSSPKYIAVPGAGFLHTLFVFIALLPGVVRLVRGKRIDLINVHWAFPDGVAGSWLSRLLRIPFVLSAHGSDINRYAHCLLRRPQIAGALGVARRVTAVSAAQKVNILRLGADPAKVRVIPNGVDAARFAVRDKDRCRRRLDIAGGKKLILFVGRLDPVKGLPVLFEAMRLLLRDKGPLGDLAVVGGGRLRAEYERLAASLGLSATVRFYGERSYAELPLWFGACDTLCLPSVSEGCPNVVLEALSCGRPVVASRVGGIPDLVRGESGILVEPGDAHALAAALMKAGETDWDAAAIRRSVAPYTWERIAGRYAGLYAEVREGA